MAKVSFNKIIPIKNLEAKIVNIGENYITIEQYLQY